MLAIRKYIALIPANIWVVINVFQRDQPSGGRWVTSKGLLCTTYEVRIEFRQGQEVRMKPLSGWMGNMLI